MEGRGEGPHGAAAAAAAAAVRCPVEVVRCRRTQALAAQSDQSYPSVVCCPAPWVATALVGLMLVEIDLSTALSRAAPKWAVAAAVEEEA